MTEGKRGLWLEEREALAQWCQEQGQPPFRAKQIRQGALRRPEPTFAGMTDLPADLRRRLESDWTIFATTVAASSGEADATRKVLLRLTDDHTVESVLLCEEERRTVCLSTQVGCGMGCVFCASGIGGVVRNLRPGEMIEQLLQLRRLLPESERLSHIVVMGMGEPLANLDNLLVALDFATAKEGLGISARHVIISTVGLPAKIRQLAATGKPYHLAVSLHAPNEQIRRQIVPTAEKVALSEILAAADDFRAQTGRQVTFEYVLLDAINDRPPHAEQLARLLAGRDALINLIPYNPVEGLPYRTPDPTVSTQFAAILRRAGLVVKIRKRKGARIDAACGQLRRSAATETLVSLQGR